MCGYIVRIGIDARSFVWDKGKITGIGHYIYETMKVWMRECKEDEFFLLSHRELPLDIQMPDNWHAVSDRGIFRIGRIWERTRLPYYIRKFKLDVFWGSYYSLPMKVKQTKYFVSIYDLALWKYPSVGETSNVAYLQMRTGRACKRADAVLTISQATAEDIADIYHVKRERIAVCYCGGAADRADINREIAMDSIHPALAFEQEYILFVSTIEPRKNVLSIIHAFERYKEKTGSFVRLVLAGKRGWNCDDVYWAVDHSQYKEDIIMPGYITCDEKMYLYQHAKMFVFPSLYEGFGIPVLEAMEYGLPVITSRISSLPEVGGDAVLYIDDPGDVDALAGQMEKVCNMSAEEVERLRNKMRMQVEKFSWENCADDIMNVFQGNLDNNYGDDDKIKANDPGRIKI